MFRFTITGFHQNGRRVSKDNDNNVRIVCTTQEGSVLAIWGSENTSNTSNIEKIEAAEQLNGFPFKIDCKINGDPPPKNFQTEYGHGHWIGENNYLEIL